MGLIRRWRERLEAIGGGAAALGAGSGLAGSASTGALVPPDADYVTVSLVRLLADAHRFLGGPAGRVAPQYRYGLTPPGGSEPGTAALLVLGAGQLRVVTEQEQTWARPVRELSDLDAHRHGGFVLVCRDGSGLVSTTPGPVQVPPGVGWRTIRGATNLVGGWDTVLAPHGVRVHW